MRAVHIKKGLDLPLAGRPAQQIHDAPPVSRVAITAADFPGMKPRFVLREGDTVKRGQAIFEDRKAPGVLHTAPAAGTITHVHRGARRVLQTVVIDLSPAEAAGDADAVEYAELPAWTGKPADQLSDDDVRALLLQSGLWTGMRTRPFGRTPPPSTKPDIVLVPAIDTRPLAASPDVVLKDRMADFHQGLVALSKLCPDNCHLARAEGSTIDAGPAKAVTVSDFSGPHPAGLPGTHLHFIDPVHRSRVAWIMGYQHVVALGALVRTGKLDVSHVVSLAGPPVTKPRLLRTRQGASTVQLSAGQVTAGELRIISGCVLSGRTANDPVHGFLGRHHDQVSVLREDREREFFGWLKPGGDRFSNIPIYLGNILRGQGFDMGTALHGEHRAIVPIGLYERVMPLDIEPTFLLRALQSGDIEHAEALGCLELDEEDLGLCTFACANKVDHQGALRSMLDMIWKEGV